MHPIYLERDQGAWRALLAAALISSSICQTAFGQFSTVYNLPPDPDFGNNVTIGSDTQVNLSVGGSIGSFFSTDGPNVEVNVSGGIVGARSGNEPLDILTLGAGGHANISGGIIDATLSTSAGSSIHVSGGIISGPLIVSEGSSARISGGYLDSLGLRSGSTARIAGGEFRLDGIPITGLIQVGDSMSLGLGSDSILTGTLSDGNVLILVAGASGVNDEVLTLEAAAVPVAMPEITLPGDADPRRLRPGQTLIVNNNGVVGDDFEAIWDSTVQINGGEIGDEFRATGAQVSMSEGTIGREFFVSNNSTVDIGGGSVLGRLILTDSELNINGGSVNVINAFFDSQVNVSGGEVQGTLGVFRDVVATVSGGTVRLVRQGLEGVPDYLDGGVLDVIGGHVVSVDQANAGGVVNISSGSIGSITSRSTVNVSGGLIGRISQQSGTVFITGGSLGTSSRTTRGTVSMSDGSIGDNFHADGGDILITGGAIGKRFQVSSGSEIDIWGGTINDELQMNNGAIVNLHGAEFRVNGVLLGGLTDVGDSLNYDLPDNSVLSGTLSDGSTFIFSSLDGDAIRDGRLTLEVNEVPPLSTDGIVVPAAPAPSGIREGETLTVNDGGELGHSFTATWGSTVNILGGVVGENMETIGATVIVSGGSVGNQFDAFTGTNLTLSGGSLGDYLDAYDGSNIMISAGSVGQYFQAHEGSLVSITGGSVGASFDAEDGSSVAISDGLIGGGFDANGGSSVNISGGSFHNDFDAFEGSGVEISGGDFRLDGIAVSGLENVGNSVPFDIPSGSVLTGTLSDGTPFAFSSFDSDSFAEGTLSLTVTELPPVGPVTTTIPANPTPLGVRSGQALQLDPGGSLGHSFNAGHGSTVNILSGEVGSNFEAVGAEVNVSGGTVGDDFDAFHESTITISGGSIGDDFTAYFGSTVSVSGGTIGDSFTAQNGSVANISGGSLGQRFSAFDTSVVYVSGGSFQREFAAHEGSQVNISGGAFGDAFTSRVGSTVAISGNDFRIDGIPVDGLGLIGDEVSLDEFGESVLSGILADGTPFVFSTTRYGWTGFSREDTLDGTIKLVAASLPAVGPASITLPGSALPFGLRSGQTLNVNNNGSLPANFNASWGSSIVINGGEVGSNLEAVGATIELHSGTIGSGFYALHGTTVSVFGGEIDLALRIEDSSVLNVVGGTVKQAIHVQDSVVNILGGEVQGGAQFLAPVFESSVLNISEGSLGPFAEARGGSVVNITGGEVGSSFRASENTSVNISGGTVSGLRSQTDAVVNVSGGNVGDYSSLQSITNIYGGNFEGLFQAYPESEIHLYGTEFILDGVELEALIPGLPLVINARDVTLSGLLTDGSDFSFELNSSRTFTGDYFDPQAILSLTLALPGDFDLDGDVDGADFLSWQRDSNLGELADWQANFEHSTHTAPLGGDFDSNSNVNGADFLTWQRDTSVGYLGYWQTYYGDTLQALSASNAVPEPSSLAILLRMAAFGVLSVRQRVASH